VLVGLPASGKSTVGRALAARLGVGFADSDDLIVGTTGRTIADWFTDGEAAFRAVEAAAITAALSEMDGVLAVGGGAVTTASVRQSLGESAALVVELRADQATLVSRLGGGPPRPLLAQDPAGRLATLAASREPLYAEVADTVVRSGGRTVGDVVADIVAALAAGAPARDAPATPGAGRG
jgi:shikimate kinase